MIALLIFAFFSGLVTAALPCILPVLPIVLAAGLQQGRWRPLGIMLGVIGSFTVFTLTLSLITSALGISADTLRLAAIVIIGGLGVLFLWPGALTHLEGLISHWLPKPDTRRPRQGFGGGLVLGASLGLIWTPCAGPILAAVTTLASTQQFSLSIVAVTVAYALGIALPLFAIAYGSQRLVARINRLKQHLGMIQRGFGGVLIVMAVMMAFGLDRQLQASVLETLPDGWQASLQRFEESDRATEQLEQLGR